MHLNALYESAVRLQSSGRLVEARHTLQQLLARTPEHAAAWHLLGLIAYQQGQGSDAVTLFEKAIAIEPTGEFHCSLGNALRDLGQYEAALEQFHTAVALDPHNAGAYNNLGVTLHLGGAKQAAVECYRKALALAPDYAGTHSNLGCALKDLGDFAPAVESFERSLALHPQQLRIHSNLLFCLAHMEGVNPSALAEHLARFDRCFAETPRFNFYRQEFTDPARRLRVGFVSGDLCDHAVAYFLEPLWAGLDPAEVEIWAYSNHRREDAVSARLKSRAYRWCNIATLGDDALARQIHIDAIDILIDLSGHTAANRLAVFARKPAPVQVSWLGFPCSTGLRAMDYYLADPHLAPKGALDAQFTEKIVRLPAAAGFLPPQNAPSVNELPALSGAGMTFGSFHRTAKLGDAALALWSRVLCAVPDSRLLLAGLGEAGLQARLAEAFERQGVARQRLIFQPRLPLQGYLQLHNQVDMILDSYPYAGGTTSVHAAWMGVPVLTLAGEQMPARQGAAVMLQLGLNDFVTHSPEAFVTRAAEWSRRLPELNALRQGLRKRVGGAPAANPQALATVFSRALRQMWQRRCLGLPPEPFDISEW